MDAANTETKGQTVTQDDPRLKTLTDMIARQVAALLGDGDPVAKALTQHLCNNVAQAWPVIMSHNDD